MPKEIYYSLCVLWAIWLCTVSISLTAIVKVAYSSKTWPAFELFVWFIVGAAIPAVLNWFTMKAYDWARAVTILLLLIGISLNPRTISENMNSNLPMALVGIGTFILQLTAVVLLFSKPASNWFKTSRELRNSKAVTHIP